MRFAMGAMLVCVLAAGCGKPTAKTDDPDEPTSGADSGPAADSGTKPDAGPSGDGGSGKDAGSTDSGGSDTDAGSDDDGGLPVDAGSVGDAGSSDDAGFEDGGGSEDAGSDVDGGPGCTSDCTSLGASRCASTDIEYCLETAESCLQWVRSPCPDGERCFGDPALCITIGTCTDDCAALATRCASPTELETCEVGSDGCLHWAASTCPTGDTCGGNPAECQAASCSDDCTTVLDTRCASATRLETCEYGVDGCLHWATSSCPTGDTCGGDPAECQAATCTDDCTTFYDTRCASATQLETCDYGSDGCLHWAVSTCSNGETCGGTPAECQVATCTDDCTTFYDTRCASATELETCDYGSDGCLHWALSNCSTGETCGGSPAECQTATCTDDCTTELDTRCASGTELETCETGTDGCLHWVASPCPSGETCGGTPAECQVATCTDDCAVELETRCASTTQLETCEVGADGCLHWATSTCPTGETCSGSPAQCGSDCTTENETLCATASQLLTCSPDPVSGGLRWAMTDCASAEVCVGAPGRCALPCATEGETQCASTTELQTCEAVPEAGLYWMTAACPTGEACGGTPAACAPTCTHECDTLAATECLDTGTLRTCENGADGCRQWKSTACVTGEACGGTPAACAPTCIHECDTLAATECLDAATLRTCENGADGCRHWSSATCVTGEACGGTPAACAPTCTHECDTLAATECLDTATLRTCEDGTDGCRHWKSTTCATNEACGGTPAACATTCTHECDTLAVTECLDTATLRTCENGTDGCRHWRSTTCATNEACGGTPAACAPTCTHECDTVGATDCLDTATLRTCEDGTDGCRHWTSAACVTGEACGGTPAACAATCTHECDTVAATECLDTATLRTCEDGTDGCRHWTSAACVTGEACGGTPAACAATCTHECDTVGATDCLDTATLRTCEDGTDGCRHWKSTACAMNEACGGTPAACAATCTHECDTVGATDCLDTATLRTCEDGTDGCRHWTSAACVTGEACGGTPAACAATCTDECDTVAATECLDTATLRTCENGADGCRHWKSTTCATSEVCGGTPAACAATCTHECDTVGATECLDAATLRTCENGTDGCRRWTNTPCLTGEACDGTPAACSSDCLVEGTLSGLAAGATLTLSDGAQDLALTANGTFSFAQVRAIGDAVTLSIKGNPAAQACRLTVTTGRCEAGTDLTVECCTPSCAGKACGSDGCFGQCGGCPGGTCGADGFCTGFTFSAVDPTPTTLASIDDWTCTAAPARPALAAAAITVDGDLSDWPASARILVDHQNEQRATRPGFDLREVYAARDATHMTVGLRVDGPPSPDSYYQIDVGPKANQASPPTSATIVVSGSSLGRWVGADFAWMSDGVVARGDAIELRFPLASVSPAAGTVLRIAARSYDPVYAHALADQTGFYFHGTSTRGCRVNSVRGPVDVYVHEPVEGDTEFAQSALYTHAVFFPLVEALVEAPYPFTTLDVSADDGLDRSGVSTGYAAAGEIGVRGWAQIDHRDLRMHSHFAAHETAHSWNVVMGKRWLQEGHARWIQNLFPAVFHGKRADWRDRLNMADNVVFAGGWDRLLDAWEPANTGADLDRLYGKSALAISVMGGLWGESQVKRAFNRRFALGGGDSAAFQAELERVIGKSAQEAFAGWITAGPYVWDPADRIFDDADLDWLPALEEQTAGTNAAQPDSDGDGVSDGADFLASLSPKVADTDGDGTSDLDELGKRVADGFPWDWNLRPESADRVVDDPPDDRDASCTDAGLDLSNFRFQRRGDTLFVLLETAGALVTNGNLGFFEVVLDVDADGTWDASFYGGGTDQFLRIWDKNRADRGTGYGWTFSAGSAFEAQIRLDAFSTPPGATVKAFGRSYGGSVICDQTGAASSAEACTLDGSVTGLSGTVVLTDGRQDLSLNANGSFAFTSAYSVADAFGVTVKTQPAGQICDVGGGNGTCSEATSIAVSCRPAPCVVDGVVSGLAGTLVLTDGTQDLTLNADGAFAFATSYVLADPFSVTVKTQPAGQTCTISVGTGTGSCSAETSVTVGCVTDPLPPALSLSRTSVAFSASAGGSDPAVQTVTVSNSGDGVLALPSTTVEYTNGSGWLTPTVSGTSAPFTLELHATLGGLTVGTYRAVVHVSAAGASNSPADIAVTFDVAPAPAFRVGGDVSGLLGTLVLQNNGGDDLTLSADGTFTFASRVDDGATYSVSVKTQPTDQTCTVTSGTGRVSGGDVTNVQVSCGPSSSDFTVAGTVEFDWIPALDDVTEGGVRLDYAAKVSKPARRVMIQALDTSDDSLVAQTLTKDDGTFTLAIPRGKTVRVIILARSTVTNYQRDGIGPDNCHGASWDLRLVDNTSGGAQYGMQSPSTYGTTTTDLYLRAPVEYSGGRYTSRAGATFAILDTLVTEFELICTGQADLTLPLLNINWSPNNTTSSGDRTTGAIGTSHYRREIDGTSALYILGKEDVDTDEFDDHVIAHEGGHFLEKVLYRSDSIGGTHGGGDSLDPRVAFGEGFGNALSAMVFTDPNYVDSSGTGQANGMTLEIAAAPTSDDRGVYSEGSMQYFLWKLFDARDAAPNLGSFDRIHAVLMQHRSTAAYTCGQTFAALYNAAYGDADGLRQLWENELATPYGSLCSGNCSGSAGGTADLFDLDNDLGLAYGVSSVRHYPQETGLTYGPEFWRLYPLLAVGSPRNGEHEQIATGDYDAKSNKFGATRWYRFLGTGGAVTLTVSNLQGGASCTDDVLDMLIFKNGTRLSWDEEVSGPTAGCPQVTLDGTDLDAVYTVDVRSFGTNISNYTITLQ